MFIYVCIYLNILSYDYIFINFAHSHITFVNLSIVSCMCSYINIEYTWCSRRHTIFSWVPDFLNTFLWPTSESIYSLYACTQLNNIPIRGWTRHNSHDLIVSCSPIWVIDVITVIVVGMTAPSWKTMTCGWMNHHPSVGKLSSGAVQNQDKSSKTTKKAYAGY